MLEQLYYIPVDKLLHVIVGMLIYITVTTISNELNIKIKLIDLLIFGICLWVGILKESYDQLYKLGGSFDDVDILYTVIGGLMPIFLKKILKIFLKIFVRTK